MTMTNDKLSADSNCPSGEELAAFLTVGTASSLYQSTSSHLEHCDACLSNVSVARRRLALVEEMSTPVPNEIRAGAYEACVGNAPPWSSTTSTGALWSQARTWLQSLLQPQSLVPAAVAVAAVFMIVTAAEDRGGVLSDGVRAVQQRQQERISADVGVVRVSPRAGAYELRKLYRGESVTLYGQRGDWYQVEMSDGIQGWLRRSALH